MKLRNILTIGFAGVALSIMAQTHKEGVEYFKADQFDNAKTLLERNMDKPGTDKAVSHYYLGRIAMLEEKYDEAAKHFELGAQANPDYGYNYVGLGALQLKQGDAQLAAKDFKQAESCDKKDAELQIDIARAYYDANPELYAKEIAKRIQNATKKDKENPSIYIFEGDRYADQKDWGHAGTQYEMAVGYDPNATGAYVKYANLFRMVNPQYSIDMLKKLLEVNPQSALGQRELANAYYNTENYAEAAKQYGNYVNNPNHFKEDEDRYALLLFSDGKYQQGYDYATKLLQSNPGNFTAQRFQFMNAAQIPAMADQMLPLAESLYAAHKANPAKNKFAPIDYNLIADELQRNKRPDEAITVIEEAIQTMPDNANFNKVLASIYVDLNNLPGAADAYAGYIAKTKKPDYNDYIQQALYDYFAGAQTIKDDPAKSNEYFAKATENANKASEAAPNQYKPKKVLGDVAIAQAPKEEIAKVAFPMYSEAIVLLEGSKDPSRYTSDAKAIYNYLGNYWLDQKDTAKAKEYFNKYLTLDPNNEQYRKFVESL